MPSKTYLPFRDALAGLERFKLDNPLPWAERDGPRREVTSSHSTGLLVPVEVFRSSHHLNSHEPSPCTPWSGSGTRHHGPPGHSALRLLSEPPLGGDLHGGPDNNPGVLGML